MTGKSNNVHTTSKSINLLTNKVNECGDGFKWKLTRSKRERDLRLAFSKQTTLTMIVYEMMTSDGRILMSIKTNIPHMFIIGLCNDVRDNPR